MIIALYKVFILLIVIMVIIYMQYDKDSSFSKPSSENEADFNEMNETEDEQSIAST